MKANLIFFVIIFLGFKQLGLAQDQQKVIYQAKISPLALIDPITPCFQIGGQATYGKFAGSLEFGIPYKGLANLIYKNWEEHRKNNRYFKIRNEFKYLFRPHSYDPLSFGVLYAGFESFFIPQTYKKTNSYIIREAVYYHYDVSNVKKEVWGLCLKLGWEIPIEKKLMFDLYAGFGVRQLNILHQTMGEQVDDEEFYRSDIWITIDHREGISLRPHLAAGLKLGYIINK